MTSENTFDKASDFYVIDHDYKIHPNTKIIKADAYLKYLDAHAIIEQAEIYAQKIKNQADEVLTAANQKAAHIVEEAEKEYTEEKKRGFIEGKKEFSQQITETVVETSTYLASIEDDIIHTIESAIKIILGEIGDEKIMEHLIIKALNSVRKEKHLRLRVAPEQIEFVTEEIKEIKAEYNNIDFIEVVSDGNLTKGGCVLETEMGFIDVSLDFQMDAIKSSLAQRFNQLR